MDSGYDLHYDEQSQRELWEHLTTPQNFRKLEQILLRESNALLAMRELKPTKKRKHSQLVEPDELDLFLKPTMISSIEKLLEQKDMPIVQTAYGCGYYHYGPMGTFTFVTMGTAFAGWGAYLPSLNPEPLVLTIAGLFFTAGTYIALTPFLRNKEATRREQARDAAIVSGKAYIIEPGSEENVSQQIVSAQVDYLMSTAPLSRARYGRYAVEEFARTMEHDVLDSFPSQFHDKRLIFAESRFAKLKATYTAMAIASSYRPNIRISDLPKTRFDRLMMGVVAGGIDGQASDRVSRTYGIPPLKAMVQAFLRIDAQDMQRPQLYQQILSGEYRKGLLSIRSNQTNPELH